MKHVILGAGPAGVVAAETLRKADPQGGVILVGGEPEPPYSRMAIPYVLTGMIEEDGTYLRKDAGHYEGLGIDYRHGRAEKVVPKEKKVLLEGGDSLSYDRLLIATGAHPIKPPVPGLDLPGVHHCWTLADYRGIAELAKPGAKVVLMGAGFIGSIILESLVARGVELTVIEMEDRMVPRMMNQTAGQLLKRWCESKGVRVMTSTRVSEVTAADGGLQVATAGGETLEAKLLVVAAGVAANVGFLEGSGIKLDDGVLVDDHLRSSDLSIYAAGDVAKGPDFGGGFSVHAIQPTAVEHGRLAALNMAMCNAPYKGSLVMNVLDTLGLISCSFGQWAGVAGGEGAEQLDEANYKYMRLEFEGDHLVGALSLGRTEHVGVIRGLIQTRTRLGEWKSALMADPHRIMEAYVALSQV